MFLIPKDYWELRRIKGKGRGIIALKNIPKVTIIGDYIGKVLHPRDSVIDENNFYLMYYHDRAVISPNFKKPGVYLLNHSCKPNCWLYIYKGHTLVFALRKILKKEEITIPYLLPPIDKYCNPCLHVCRCRNLKCTGTMHMSKEKYKKWRKITDRQSKETKKEKIKYGQDLAVLLDYPEKIPEDYLKETGELFI